MAELTSPFPILVTDDLPRAVAFYAGQFGYEATYRWSEGAEAVYVTLRLGAAALGLSSSAVPPTHDRPVPPPAGHRTELCFTAADTDTAVDDLRAAGVPVLTEPFDAPWGERSAYVADPDGMPILIVGPMRPSGARPSSSP